MNNEQRMVKAVDELVKKIANDHNYRDESVIFADVTGEFIFVLGYNVEEDYICVTRWYEYEPLIIATVNTSYCTFTFAGEDEPENLSAMKDRVINILSAEI